MRNSLGISTARTLIILFVYVAATGGCQTTRAGSSDQPSGAAERGATEGAAATKAPQPTGEDDHEHESPGGHSPTEGAAGEDTVLLATEAVGQPISDDVELVDAAALLANPDEFSGRTVRIKGTVKGFCHHRRAWFAIDVPGANPPYLRVVTAPDFQVPPGIMNAEATAVGTVEVQATPRSRVTHYEKEHQLGTGEGDGPGRAKRVVVRAAGAVFSPAG